MEMAEKDGTEGRCPACRTPYDKEKIVGMATDCERLLHNCAVYWFILFVELLSDFTTFFAEQVSS